MKNNFQELEDYKVKRHGEVPKEIHENIETNLVILKTIGQTVELFTEKFIKTILKMNS